jgi:hypothetical protein
MDATLLDEDALVSIHHGLKPRDPRVFSISLVKMWIRLTER